jgi:citrate lyase subunit beta / citryl-CoA lyase
MTRGNIEPRPSRRSLLFVPAAEPRKLERAAEARADAVVLDLEDSVAPEQKSEARRLVAETLRSGRFGDRDVVVRVNAPGTAEFEADLETVIEAGGRRIMLPKCERPEPIRMVPNDVAILALVETPGGIANALAIAAATPALEALCFGPADFAFEMGLRETDASRGILYHARCMLVIAAKASSVAPIDSVHLAVKDEKAFREDAELGLRLGFEGKLCIHPRQVEIVNEVYTPTVDEIDHAKRILEAAEQARAEGRGVFTLDGKMIDAPAIAAARRIIERTRRSVL